MEARSSLVRSMGRSLAGLFVLLVVIVALMGFSWEWNEFQNETEEIREMQMESHRDLLRSFVSEAGRYIEHTRETDLDEFRRRLRSQARQTAMAVEHLWEAGTRDPAVLAEAAAVTDAMHLDIACLLFDMDGRSVYWGLPGPPPGDMDEAEAHELPQLVLDQARSGLGGEVITPEWGQGSGRMGWVEPLEVGGLAVAALVREHVVQRTAQQQVLRWLSRMKIGGEYVFAGTWTGNSLLGPAQGRNMWDLQDENGLFVVRELVEAARTGGGFVEYQRPAFDEEPVHKLSYVVGVDDWQWYLGVGVSLDELEQDLAARRAELRADMTTQLGLLGFGLAIICLLSMVIANSMARRIRANLARFESFFDQASRGSATIDEDEIDYVEFVGLARSANRMVRERDAAQSELAASEERYRRLMANANDAMFLTDDTGVIVDVNRRACEMLGYEREELLGMRVWEVDQGVTRENWIENIDMIRGMEQVRHQGTHRRKDGTLLAVEISLASFEWEERDWFLAIARDMSDRRRYEQGLRQAKEAAEEASRVKSEFLANMSHEVRTPLNGILGMLQLLEMTGHTPEQGELVAMALESGRGLLQIIGDILDLSKIERGVVELVEAEFTPARVVKPVADSLKSQAAERGLAIEVRIDDALPGRFVGDAGRIRQILFNLMGNAVKFSEQGTVRVSMRATGGLRKDGRLPVLISVEDHGVGVPDELMERIFEPFTQADGSSTRRYQGAGLGLGLVSRLVEIMGGSLSIESEPGNGTTVWVTLWLAPAETGVPETGAAEEDRPVGRSLRVLVAEDDPTNQFMARRLLEKEGHDPVCVVDGERAVQELTAGWYDVVLMDIQMPVLDGIAATRRVRALPPESPNRDVPIAALTAHAMKGDRSRFLAAGMDAYIPKPVELNALRRCLARMAAKPRAHSSTD